MYNPVWNGKNTVSAHQCPGLGKRSLRGSFSVFFQIVRFFFAAMPDFGNLTIDKTRKIVFT